MKLGILIPVYQPEQGLVELAAELAAADVPVVVVNDGSTSGAQVLERLREMPGVTLLEHEVNRGKGAALKTGLAWMADRGFDGAVTADADGQHTPEDIHRVARAMEEHPGCLILGARDVAKMPPRSRTGNSLTRTLVRLLYGIRVQDTQTGLRGIPLEGKGLSALLALPGDRYEYEMEMLAESPRLFPEGIREVPIETLYFDGNSGSHFRPLQDGARIYKVLFRKLPGFLLSSMTSFGLDYLLFNLLYYQVLPQGAGTTFIATVGARLCSGTCNFLVNKNLLFKDSGGKYTFLNYWKLAIGILAANLVIIHLLVDFLHLPAFLMKILVEAMLFFVNFTVQHAWARDPAQGKK